MEPRKGELFEPRNAALVRDFQSKTMAAPYAHLRLKFVPLGELNAKNMASYLADAEVAALRGSWLAPRELIKAGNGKNHALAVEIIKSTRTK